MTMLHAILGNASAFLANALGAGDGPSFWMPRKASSISGEVDGLFYFVYWLCLFFFLLVTVLLVVFVIKYRHREGRKHESAAGHSTALELTWTIIPTVLVLVIFYYGFRGYLNMTVEPPDPYEITVTGKMWNWSFTYPNGYTELGGELHLPKGRPIRIVLESKDVIHSFYIPEFRVKKDAVPGRYNRLWFTATQVTPKEGFDLFCAEYCGTNHSEMLAKVFVHEQADFDKWLENASNWTRTESPLQHGEKIVKTQCAQCHTVDGGAKIGPTFKDLFGSQVPLQGGGTAPVNEEYVMESIRAPQAKLHAGYPPQMPAFSDTQLKKWDVDAITWYLKSISSNYKGDLAPAKTVKPLDPRGNPLGAGAAPAPAPGPAPAPSPR